MGHLPRDHKQKKAISQCFLAGGLPRLGEQVDLV